MGLQRRHRILPLQRLHVTRQVEHTILLIRFRIVIFCGKYSLLQDIYTGGDVVIGLFVDESVRSSAWHFGNRYSLFLLFRPQERRDILVSVNGALLREVQLDQLARDMTWRLDLRDSGFVPKQ